ncbi:hypothetical protein B0A55_08985 [Friedmanniomyces simplex]|uniref:Uncharacterized protein n=1 Tax=Friedmanniomyces simplex TaxID=329884 RepID=A0A4U0WYN9_9PEZI|nr:hypothetical protein B0A55_08985 [Friedmanniomyces simplex]
MAEDWRRVHAPQVSGFHLLQHTITFDMRGTACEEELDARIRDDAIGEDSDADVERLKLDRCLTHETVPEHHRRRSILNVLQNLRRPASADGNNHVALECLDDDKNGVDLQPVTVSLEPAISAGRGRHAGAPTIVDRAERQLKRRASSITDRFKGYEPFRHHVQKPLAACEASNSSGDHGQRKATVSPVEHHD